MVRRSILLPSAALVFVAGAVGAVEGSAVRVILEPETVPPVEVEEVAATTVPLVEEPSACPENMVLVEGEYCPKVQHRCLRYLDPPGTYENFRCAEYAQPAICKSEQKVKMRFCIDRDEYAEPGEKRPANFKSFTDAKRLCKAQGKRVCTESEWNFACEGEEMRPYPYGFERDAEACHADQKDIVDRKVGKLYDLRAPTGSHPECISPFGVRDLSGSMEEFVAIDGTSARRPAMKGAYWQPGRNHCRAAQTAHDSYYNGTETGFRCCGEPTE